MAASASSTLSHEGTGAYQVVSHTAPANKLAAQLCQVSWRRKISSSAAAKTVSDMVSPCYRLSPVMYRLTPEHQEAFRRDGYLVVENLFD